MTIETIFKNKNGRIIHGDNLDLLSVLKDNSVDSCISDFPYDLSFMGRKWDNMSNFYEWNKIRAEGLLRVIKPGGYVAIFGHPKTNHRMKCAFEDAGFKIVEEVDWIYLTGMPKNQDIGKLFDKAANVDRTEGARVWSGGQRSCGIMGNNLGTQSIIKYDTPATDLAKQWDGWKTAGLKPAHEPITIFQKPLEGTYIQNIEKYDCGGMNIDACRVPTGETITNHSRNSDSAVSKGIYGDSQQQKTYQTEGQQLGRFPPNIIFDEFSKEILDEQTGIKTSGSNCVRTKEHSFFDHKGSGKAGDVQITYGDTGVGSRMFPIIKYCTKVSPSERKLPNGERNPHVTLKPIALIEWLIKLLTPVDGNTIDITAGSCTHAAACEKLNQTEGYNLKWIDVEIMNTTEEPYCNTGKIRLETICCGAD